MLFHCRVTPNIIFAGTHLHTWAERGTVRVSCKCLAQEHNAVSPAKVLDSQLSRPTTRPQHLHKWIGVALTFCCFHCRGESYPDKQESPEIKSKKGPEGTESFSCIFVLGQLWESEHIWDEFMLSPQSDIDERQRVLRWACLIYLFCCHVICSGKRKSNIAL